MLDNVSVATKANIYFDGKCVSHTIIKADGGGPAVRRLLKDRGVPTLRRAGVPLLQQGQTSLEELLRMT